MDLIETPWFRPLSCSLKLQFYLEPSHKLLPLQLQSSWARKTQELTNSNIMTEYIRCKVSVTAWNSVYSQRYKEALLYHPHNFIDILINKSYYEDLINITLITTNLCYVNRNKFFFCSLVWHNGTHKTKFSHGYTHYTLMGTATFLIAFFSY